jgi:hypothetical protein
MKFHKFFLVGLVGLVLFVSLFSARPAHAILGDVNGDESVSISDVVYLKQYLFHGGSPPVVRNDADVDSCPGVNLGDVYQILGYLFFQKQLYHPVGEDLIVPSGIKITTGWLKGASTGDTLYLPVKIKTTDDSALYAMVIPLSYKRLSGQTELNCIGVDTAGTILNGGTVVDSIDNQNKKVLVTVIGNTSDPPVVPAESDGMIFELIFEVVTPGDPTHIPATYFEPEHTMLLISKFFHDSGDPPGRLIQPKFFLDDVGDVNCDGKVDVQDLVYLNNYLFRSGPPPCNP